MKIDKSAIRPKVEKVKNYFAKLTPEDKEKLMDTVAKAIVDPVWHDSYENRKIKGIHKSRYVASWTNAGGTMEYVDEFREWLSTLEIDGEHLTPDEIDEIDWYGRNGKMELEHSAEDFLANESH